jgi:RHS repeat-associated protein
MMPAAKHGDMQMGVDIHLCMVPCPAPVPTPLPTPHMSVVFDPFDYVPVIGATVTVCGMKRATAGTAGKVVHIPPGFPFAPKMPDTEDELFMGSSTVVADGDPMSHIAHPVLSCQAVGMLSPFRLKKKGGPRACVLPTVFNLATPSTVFVGGPPTISMMGMAMKGVFAGLGKLAKMGVFKRMRQKLFKNMKPGFLKCTVLRAEPVNILSGAVCVEQQDFILPGRITLHWLRSYSSSNGHVGLCGPGWETPADIRLEIDAADGSVMLHGPGVGPLSFERLPRAPGQAAAELELSDGAWLSDHGDAWQVSTREGRSYRFPKLLASRAADGRGVVPIGRIADSCGNALLFEYRSGRVVAVEESAGRRLALNTESGRLSAVTLIDRSTGAEHVFVRYGYDAAGDLVVVHDALGQPYRFEYEQHCMLRHTDRNGLSFHYAFDAEQRVVHAWGDGGLHDYRFEYLDALNERRITDSLGHVSLVKLCERGLPISEIDAHGGITVYEYDDGGRTTAVVDAAGRRSEWVYDERGNLLRHVRPDGSAIAVEFDAEGRAVAITDACGGRWLQQWDERGLLLAQTSPLGHASRYEYDRHGLLAAVVNPRGARTVLRFDALGQLAELTDALGHCTLFAHDMRGNLIARGDALDRRTTYAYDAKNRLLAVRRPDGAVLRYGYDAEDNLASCADGSGEASRFEYFGQGSIARRIRPDGRSVEYEYDSEERLVGVRNECGQHYRMRRDALGQVVEHTDYWGQAWRHDFDAGGHRVASIDPLGQRIELACDAVGRVLRKTLPCRPGTAVPWIETFAYDANGAMLHAANPHGAFTCALDAEGRLLSEEQVHATGDRFTVENRYDACGNRVRRTTGGSAGPGHVTEWAYDLADRMTGMRIDGGEPVRTLHDANGRVCEEALAPGLKRRCRYGPDGQLGEQGFTLDEVPLFATRYLHDAGGRLVQRSDSELGIDRFVRDPLGRIVEHIDPQGQVEQWLNDEIGDRLAAQAVVGAPAGARISREGRHGGRCHAFDGAGNLVLRTEGRSRLELAWDANQRLFASRRTTPEGVTLTTYGYDPLGRRLFKETRGLRTWFGWDGDTLALDVAGERVREFVHRPGGFVPFAALQSTGAAAAAVLYYVNDPNGCPTRVVDARGRALWLARHGAWGEAEVLAARSFDNPLRLQGQYHDDETGLHYNRYRYFDPTAGQFVSLDPIRLLGGLALYQYAADAFTWIDPLGLAGCKGSMTKEFYENQYRKVTRGDLVDADDFLRADGVVLKAHGSKHGIPKVDQVDVLNNWEKSFTGQNYNGRPVDIYWKADRVVVTQAGDKSKVITAYDSVSHTRWSDRNNWRGVADGEYTDEVYSSFNRNTQR